MDGILHTVLNLVLFHFNKKESEMWRYENSFPQIMHII